MAQTGYTPILIYSSSTAAAAPVAGNLTNSTLGSELAINITDGKLFYKDNANAIQVIGWKTVPTTAGGTGLTTYTAGDLLYYASGTTLTKLGIGAANTVLTSSGSAPQWSTNLNIGSLTATSISNSGNLTFTGTGNRITGDFSNATIANRVMFQTSTVNGFTGVGILPNGTATATLFDVYNNSNPTNASRLRLTIDTATAILESGRFGTGTFLPMAFFAGGSEAMRIFTSGGVSIGNTTDPGATNLSVNGNAYIGNTSQSAASERFNVNGFGGFGDRAATNPFVLVGNTGSGNGVIGTFSNHALEIRTNNSNIATFTTGGGFTCVGIYNTTVGGTNRDVFVDNAGVVGYVTSTRSSKTNIKNLQDIDWLYRLNPVTFNYRKRNNDGKYTEEIDGDIQYGMIAEDVEQVRSDLCFYDEIDGKKELRGIQYSKLVPVMLKAIQQLKIELSDATEEIAVLKGTK